MIPKDRKQNTRSVWSTEVLFRFFGIGQIKLFPVKAKEESFRTLNPSRILIILLYLLTACQSSYSYPTSHWQQFAGRDDGTSLARPLLYRAKVPLTWQRQDPASTESIADTTKAICTFYIPEGEQTIRLTLHTFPIGESYPRIPPQAQIARWKTQFDELDALTTTVQSEAHGGFSGLFFEGQGLIQGQATKVLGWSMQLAIGYERQLNLEKYTLDRTKKADYTIKAQGPIELINKHRTEIVTFAQSFELIDELPAL